MNGADDGSSSLSQRLEQKKALIARDTVQTTACNTHTEQMIMTVIIVTTVIIAALITIIAARTFTLK